MSEMMPLIRPIQPSDDVKLAKVIRTVLLEMGMPKVGTAYGDTSLDKMYDTYQTERKAYFVVESSGEILGGGGVAPLDNFDGNVCELQKMYFLPQLRGKGIGQKMLEICLKKAKEFGFERCYLETMPYMESAIKLYRKNGFFNIDQPMGNTGHHSCLVWMTKDL